MELAKCSEEEIISVLRKNKVAEADIKSALAKTSNTTATTANTVATKAQTTAEQEHLISQYESIGGMVADTTATTTDTVAKTANLSITNLLTVAWAKLTSVIKANPLISATTAVVIALTSLYKITTKFFPSLTKASKDLKESKDNFTSITSEVNSLTQELETTNKRIDELQSKGTLSIVEDEELNKLKETTAELEYKLALKKEEQRIEAKNTADAADKAFNASFRSKYTDEGEYLTGEGKRANDPIQELSNAMKAYEKYESEYNQIQQKVVELSNKADEYQKQGLTGLANAAQKELDKYTYRAETLENQMTKASTQMNLMYDVINGQKEAYEGLYQAGYSLTPQERENYEIVKNSVDGYHNWCAEVNNTTKAFSQLTEEQKRNNLETKLVLSGVSSDNAKDILSSISNDDLDIMSTLTFNNNSTKESIQEQIDIIKNELSTVDLFSSFDTTDLGERLDHINTKFEEGTLSHKQYFDSLNDEIENFDASNFTDSLEDAQNAAAQFFTDGVQQSASGLSDLINKFDSGEIGISEYLEGYLAIGNTISTLTDELQENSAEWDKNGQAISNSQNQALDATQTKLQGAMATIEGYQDSIYSLEMMMSGAVEAGSDEFRAHANVIAQDLANIVKNGGEMANEIKNTLGTTTAEIAKSMSESVANQGLASQAIAANTNTAIADMATSIGELFDSLGQAISNFNVDLTFSKKSGSLIGAITGADPLELSFTASGKSLETIGSFVSSFGKQLSSNLAPQMIEMPDFSLGLTGDGKNGTYLPSKNITKNYEKALDGIKDTAKETKKEVKETFDFFERRIKVLDNALSLLDANLENVQGSFAKNKLIDAQIGLNSEKINNYTDAMAMYTQKANEALSKLPSDIASKIKNGAVSITDFTNSEEITKAISEYQKWADKISDCKQELAELRQALEDLELEKFNNLIDDFTNQFDIYESGKDIIDSWKNYYEESGQLIGQGIYEAGKVQSEKQLDILTKQKEALVKQLNSALNSGRVNLCPAV